MYQQMEAWLDTVLRQNMPDGVIGLNFNLYEDFKPDGGKSWSMELIGADSFDEEDEDWACDEICDFGTRENPFCWKEKEDTEWESILDRAAQMLRKYLSEGMYAEKLKQYDGIGVGFVDGNIEILYVKP